MTLSRLSVFGWLLRRELWENRAIWVVPSAIGVLLLVAALFGNMDVQGLSEPVNERFIGGSALAALSSLFFVTAVIYSSWYLLDCLYAERKDRSILFWQSLPISDAATVLSKLLTAILVIPLVYFAIADLTTLLVAFVASVRYGSTLGRVLWHVDLWLQLQAIWLYLIVTSALWFLPFSAWLLLVSAWSRRAVLLWATLPPLAVTVIEYKFFGTNHVGEWLIGHALVFVATIFHGTGDHAVWSTPSQGAEALPMPNSIWALFDPTGFLRSAQLWLSVLAGTAMVYAAILLRRRRAEV